MRAFFNGLVLGIIFGALAYWYFQRKAQEHPPGRTAFSNPPPKPAATSWLRRTIPRTHLKRNWTRLTCIRMKSAMS